MAGPPRPCPPRPSHRPAPPPAPQTYHIKARDGVSLAVDVILPPQSRHPRPVPLVFHQTRYWRSVRVRPWLRCAVRTHGKPVDWINEPAKRLAVSLGCAVVSMDARGTGASGGVWGHPWAPRERCDSLEVLMWAAAQAWSDGRAVLYGMSYDATAALHTAAFGHPAVVGVAVRYPFWDLFGAITAPGGVPLHSFTQDWSRFGALLDRGRLGPLALCVARTPVLVPEDGPLLRARRAAGGDAGAPAGARGDAAFSDAAVARSEARAGGGDGGGDGGGGFVGYRALTPGERRGLRRDGARRTGGLAGRREGNWRGGADLASVRCADDAAPSSPGRPFQAVSPCNFAPRLRRLGLDAFVETGWLDVTVPEAACVFEHLGGGDLSELVIGPW